MGCFADETAERCHITREQQDECTYQSVFFGSFCFTVIPQMQQSQCNAQPLRRPMVLLRRR